VGRRLARADVCELQQTNNSEDKCSTKRAEVSLREMWLLSGKLAIDKEVTITPIRGFRSESESMSESISDSVACRAVAS
jgi:hypothetical protein